MGLVLMVSEGRSGVKTYPVLSSNINNQVYLGNVKSSRVIEYSNLKALVEHYRYKFFQNFEILVSIMPI